jgi:translation initiation factor 2 subunit 2
MFNYEEMLNNAYENLPEKEKTEVRFELPRLVVFYEGNKTIIANFTTLADKLRRKKEHIAKFLSRELASPTILDGERLIVQRKVMQSLINKKVDEYVKTYVLCPICKRPDTKIVEEGGVKIMVCEACGAKNPVR